MKSITTLVLTALVSCFGIAQQRSMKQDPTLNNLVHPEGYTTSPPGSFGHVEKRGTGPVSLILIPGAGFGWEVFDGLIDELASDFTVYAVTLAGMGGTPAPPMPPEGTSYGEQTWIRGGVQAAVNLIKTENLDRPIVVAHFLEGAHIACRMAIDHPDLISGAVILSGAAESASPQVANATLEQRVHFMDTQMAPNWFKTVTLKTWNDNNFPPATYARDPETAARLFEQVSKGPLQVFIRYLLEFWAADLPAEFPEIKAPTLVLMPDFDSELAENPQLKWLSYYFSDSWNEAGENPLIETKKVEDSHIAMWLDQPEVVGGAIRDFAKKHGGPRQRANPQQASTPADQRPPGS